MHGTVEPKTGGIEADIQPMKERFGSEGAGRDEQGACCDEEEKISFHAFIINGRRSIATILLHFHRRIVSVLLWNILQFLSRDFIRSRQHIVFSMNYLSVRNVINEFRKSPDGETGHVPELFTAMASFWASGRFNLSGDLVCRR
jgi:hypothetical protein